MGDTATVSAAPQHLKALERANRVRLARADLKRRITAQEVRPEEVVLNCPWEAEGMSISDLLMSQRRWGRARCRRLLISLGVPENKRIGTMTDRQRLALAALLSARTGRPIALGEPVRQDVRIRVSSNAGATGAAIVY
jgi:hypothetical protein